MSDSEQEQTLHIEAEKKEAAQKAEQAAQDEAALEAEKKKATKKQSLGEKLDGLIAHLKLHGIHYAASESETEEDGAVVKVADNTKLAGADDEPALEAEQAK